MSATKEFHIGDILSVTTGRLLSIDGMDGIYDIMGFLTGNAGISTLGPLTFHDFATTELLLQFPQFKDVVVPEAVNSADTVLAFLAEMEKQYGAMHVVRRVGSPSERPGLESDLNTLAKLNPNAKVIGVLV